MFTHFYPIMEDENILGQARQFYSGDIVLAEDGLKISVSG
jgi:ribonuclease BN (tRNA processing enzyme)